MRGCIHHDGASSIRGLAGYDMMEMLEMIRIDTS